MNWERQEWAAARDADDTPVRRFAGGIEIVGEPEDALDEDVASRNTDNETEKGDE